MSKKFGIYMGERHDMIEGNVVKELRKRGYEVEKDYPIFVSSNKWSKRKIDLRVSKGDREFFIEIQCAGETTQEYESTILRIICLRGIGIIVVGEEDYSKAKYTFEMYQKHIKGKIRDVVLGVVVFTNGKETVDKIERFMEVSTKKE